MGRHKKQEATMNEEEKVVEEVAEEVVTSEPIENEVEEEVDPEAPQMACPGCGATFFHVNHFAKVNAKGQMFDEVIDFHCLGCNKNRLQFEDLVESRH
jgi:uncharacterized protein with PIN domain